MLSRPSFWAVGAHPVAASSTASAAPAGALVAIARPPRDAMVAMGAQSLMPELSPEMTIIVNNPWILVPPQRMISEASGRTGKRRAQLDRDRSAEPGAEPGADPGTAAGS